MKNFFLKYFLLLATFLCCSSASPQSNIYVGLGTGVASYLGGYFGNAYQMRVFSDYSDYYDYNYYYGYDHSYYDHYDIWSPLKFDLNVGYNLNENLSVEWGATFLFHFNGRVDPQFSDGTRGGTDYIEQNGRSNLFAIPLSATLNFHSTDYGASGFYLKFGPAVQYSSESYDRIREYYSYDNYGYSTYAIVAHVSKENWLPGFTAATGIQFSFSDFFSGYTELEYSYFRISGNNATALALDRAKEAQLFSLNTKLFVGF